MAATLEKIYEVALHHYHMSWSQEEKDFPTWWTGFMWWKKWIMCIS